MVIADDSLHAVRYRRCRAVTKKPDKHKEMGSMIASGRKCDKCTANATFRHQRYDLAFCSHHMNEVPEELKTPEWEYIGQCDVSSEPMSESHGFTADDSLVPEYNGMAPSSPTPIHMSDEDVDRYVKVGIEQIVQEQSQLSDEIGLMHSDFALEAQTASVDLAMVMHVLDTHPAVLHERDIPDHERHV